MAKKFPKSFLRKLDFILVQQRQKLKKQKNLVQLRYWMEMAILYLKRTGKMAKKYLKHYSNGEMME